MARVHPTGPTMAFCSQEVSLAVLTLLQVFSGRSHCHACDACPVCLGSFRAHPLFLGMTLWPQLVSLAALGLLFVY